MTATLLADEGASLAPDRRSAWKSSRVTALGLTALLIVSVGIAVLASRGTAGRLDPEAYDPEGSRALAELLRDNGVEVHVARRVAEARQDVAGATLLVTDPAFVPPAVLADLAAPAASTVLISPLPDILEEIAPGIGAVGLADVERRDPACPLPAATRAGDADLGGLAYAARSGPGGAATDGEAVVLCYPTGDGAALARAGDVTVLGAGDPLTNDRLDERGNAALALALLGEHDDLVWYRPGLDDPALRDGGAKPLFSLVPGAVKLALLQLAIGALVLAIWRGRRLGPVVGEPLPVVVRAAEATEGLARLYRRAHAHGRAGTALREAAVRRIAPRFGFAGAGADARAITEAVARHTGRNAREVGELLYGSAPGDDAALVALADDLDALTEQARRP